MIINICAVIKDEHNYLKHWLDFHLDIVDSITLYEDFDSLSHQFIISNYSNVTLIKLKEKEKFQINIYNNYLNNFKNKDSWTLFIDIDEFLITNRVELFNLLINNSNSSSIEFKRIDFLADGQIKADYSIPIYTRFYQLTNYKSQKPYKCIVNHNFDYILTSPHSIQNNEYSIKYYNNNNSNIFINHYFSKSWEEWKNRIKRGNFTKNFYSYEMFFSINEDLLYLKDNLIKELTI